MIYFICLSVHSISLISVGFVFLGAVQVSCVISIYVDRNVLQFAFACSPYSVLCAARPMGEIGALAEPATSTSGAKHGARGAGSVERGPSLNPDMVIPTRITSSTVRVYVADAMF